MKIEFPELDLVFSKEIRSVKLQKVIDKYNDRKPKVIVYRVDNGLIDQIVKSWCDGKFKLKGKNGIEQLGNYLYETFEIRQIRNPEKRMDKSSVKGLVYDIRDAYLK